MNMYLKYVYILYIVNRKNKTHCITKTKQYLEDRYGHFFFYRKKNHIVHSFNLKAKNTTLALIFPLRSLAWCGLSLSLMISGLFRQHWTLHHATIWFYKFSTKGFWIHNNYLLWGAILLCIVGSCFLLTRCQQQQPQLPQDIITQKDLQKFIDVSQVIKSPLVENTALNHVLLVGVISSLWV